METFDREARSSDRIVAPIFVWVGNIFCMLALAWFLVTFLCTPVAVQGRGMEPLLKDGNTVLVDRTCYHFKEPGRLDIVAFTRQTEEGEETLVRRIAGLPGETVQFLDGTLYVNGNALKITEEEYSAAVAGLASGEIRLAHDEYFMVGDWAEASEDSRFESVGNVNTDSIIGKCWFVIEPVGDIGLIR